jgi:hypothetical protein
MTYKIKMYERAPIGPLQYEIVNPSPETIDFYTTSLQGCGSVAECGDCSATGGGVAETVDNSNRVAAFAQCTCRGEPAWSSPDNQHAHSVYFLLGLTASRTARSTIEDDQLATAGTIVSKS